MSAAAETSQTVLEIYQPLIVGFWAVALGFFASAALEMLKDKLRRKNARDSLRNALIFDIRTLRQALEIEWLNLSDAEKEQEAIFIKIPRLLTDIDRLEFGKLRYNEVCALADLERLIDTLYSAADRYPDSISRSGNYFNIEIEKGSTGLNQAVELLRYYCDRSLTELEGHLRNRNHWRTGLPQKLRERSTATSVSEPDA